MSPDPSELARLALQLPTEARAALARQLLDSLPEPRRVEPLPVQPLPAEPLLDYRPGQETENLPPQLRLDIHRDTTGVTILAMPLRISPLSTFIAAGLIVFASILTLIALVLLAAGDPETAFAAAGVLLFALVPGIVAYRLFTAPRRIIRLTASPEGLHCSNAETAYRTEFFPRADLGQLRVCRFHGRSMRTLLIHKDGIPYPLIPAGSDDELQTIARELRTAWL